MRTIQEIAHQFKNQKKPFVWQLMLSQEEYELIRSLLVGPQASVNSLDSNLMMILVGEWYKREYDGKAHISDIIPDFSAREIWDNSSFRNWKQWVYESDRGREWLYSLYVLGGFASKLECGHPDDRLLEELCCLYHGEDIEISSADSRAIGLAQSIENEGSIFYLIQEIMADKFPYAKTDLENPGSDIAKLVKLIETANRQALKDKFSCEWIISYASFYETMSRRIRLGLRPERGGSGLQYLSYKIVKSWGFENPETIARIKISLRYLDGYKTIKDVDFENPLLIYSNSGSDENGFVAWNDVNRVISSDVPTSFFNRIEIAAEIQRTDFSKETQNIASNANFPEFLQLFQSAKYPTEWSTLFRRTNTAVLYNQGCKIVLPPKVKKISKPFYRTNNDKSQPKQSEPYNWTEIADQIVIQDSFGLEQTLFNRCEEIQIIFTLYSDVIRYEEDGKILHRWREDDETDWQEEYLSVMFGQGSLKLKNVATEESFDPEEIRYFQDGKEVIDVSHLHEGITELKIMVAGKDRKIKVWYVPCEDSNISPVTRDLTQSEIRWYDGQKLNVESDDLTFEMKRGNQNDYMIFTLYSPKEGHEIKIDGKIVEKLLPTDEIKIPFIFADHFEIRTLDKDGISEISGEELKNQYYKAPLQTNGDIIKTDVVRYGNIILYFFQPERNGSYVDESGYQIPIYNSVPRHYGNIIIPQFNPFNRTQGTTAIEAFSLASKYRTYFIIFKSLKEIVINGELIEKLILPLLESGELTDSIIKDLWRMAFEFHFDWMLLPRAQCQTIPQDKKEFVEKLFLSTPKAKSEQEKNRLQEFVRNYWNFGGYTGEDVLIRRAFNMMLGNNDRPVDPREFLKEFDNSPFKYHEMTKVITR